MDHSKYQENRKCPHNRGSGLNQGHSPVKRNNHYQKLLNDNEQMVYCKLLVKVKISKIPFH